MNDPGHLAEARPLTGQGKDSPVGNASRFARDDPAGREEAGRAAFGAPIGGKCACMCVPVYICIYLYIVRETDK